MSSNSKTVAGAYAKIESHEEICALRYDQIHATLSDLKEGQKSHQRIAWGIVMSLVAWMGIQLWSGVPHAQPAPVIAVASK